jgi:predicted RNA-binding protein with PUA domain
MKIAICGSLSFAKEMDEIRKKLENLGHKVFVPYSAEKILKGEYSSKEIEKKKDEGSFNSLVIQNDAIREWHKVIEKIDAILVVNYDKKGIKNYIGGNSFLEIGFAHVLHKKIFLLNPVPEISYKEEIVSMQPIVINNDFSLIK